MKFKTLFILLLTFSVANAQSLPIDFESTITTSDFIDFDGGTAAVIPNPQVGGINTSSMVAQIVRDGGAIWAGSKIELAANLDFSANSTLSMKVFSTAPVGTIVKFKLEGDGQTERDVQTTVTGEWEELTWDFTGAPADYNQVVFMFDFGNVGNGSETSTFLFDDVQQMFSGEQIDWPVDFEGSTTNYTMSDFGGNVSSLVTDPTDPTNTCIQAIKTDEAATWAGTTIGTPAGFATDIPLTLTDSKMYARVWSPEANTPIRLKVEDSNDPTHTCETETNTTLAGEWEVIEFDFINQAPGTELLEIGLQMGWTYNMASIFFNFGTEGAQAGEKTYYFDDVQFGTFISSTNTPEIAGLDLFPNPTTDQWTITSDNEVITSIEIFDAQGKLVKSIFPNNTNVRIDSTPFLTGWYVAKISRNTSTSVVKIIKG